MKKKPQVKIVFNNAVGELDFRFITIAHADRPDVRIKDAMIEMLGDTELAAGDSITIEVVE